MRLITRHIIHCSATDDNVDIGVAEIRKWHLAKGWNDIGYHWVIRRDGTLEKGRDAGISGAHVENHNWDSLGTCIIGGVEADDRMKAEANYTRAQWKALEAHVIAMNLQFPTINAILGHCDLLGVTKACPCFDVRAWWYGSKAAALIA